MFASVVIILIIVVMTIIIIYVNEIRLSYENAIGRFYEYWSNYVIISSK